jgi:glutamate synthase (NADPH/NADH) small chain
VLLALGFTGSEPEYLQDQLALPFDNRGNVARNGDYESSESGVFVAGDAGRGQSLIVWAIAEGRAAASAVDRFLEGETHLPFPVKPTDRAIAI